MISDPRPMQQRGLTLLEMMVVLLIAGMAVALGFQSLGQWRRANAAISSISGTIQQTTLTESWLADSLRGLIPVPEQTFEGSEDKLLGVTTLPVQSHQGGATDIEWSIRSEAGLPHLLLKEGTDRRLDLPLSGVSRARFAYMDKEGKLHAQWPPKLGLHDHLPAVVLLSQEMDDGSRRVWAATISGSRNPYTNPFEDDYE
ncbi:prepilin-type N-terminal cleavage/methylation domain-containing protein [Thermomonas sp. XSG]|jgi:general secretion pathway protein J|uniref:prepilin-type N-terminal cleavage/methylation domain-containing protein n=1 Tax=Thermomonas sp. XSG TaxID=2771436 RepID=UPI00167FE3CC|nr:prepilin-type N-terminal cleavage/methylation domain-containing protein [Thermomonas sp. XSG]QNU15376.1 prepilin-type N-terminal cleavage/methylation domain-containing protein [Thermomonas sp. XSG]